MCGSGYLTYPKFLHPTLNFFLQFLELEENIAEQFWSWKRIAEQNILFCYSFPTSEFGEKIHI